MEVACDGCHLYLALVQRHLRGQCVLLPVCGGCERVRAWMSRRAVTSNKPTKARKRGYIPSSSHHHIIRTNDPHTPTDKTAHQMLRQLLAWTSRTAGGRIVGGGATPCSCTRLVSFASLPFSSSSCNSSSSSSSSTSRQSPRRGATSSTSTPLASSFLRDFARISLSSPSSSFSTNAARNATPPPPPPPPPPSSPSSSSSSLPSNLFLADASVLTRYKPVPLETLNQRKEQMEGIIDPAALMLPVRKALGAGIGEEEGEHMSLDARVFGIPVRKDIIHRLVTWQRAKKRVGLASTKRVGDIRGSTKKLRPQKGGGQARAGKKHAAQFRGGMKAHGPVQRDFSFKLNKKVRALGVRMALSAKAREGKLVLVDSLSLPEPKTRLLEAALRKEGLQEDAEEGEERKMKKVLLIDGEALEQNMALAVRNLPYARGLPQLGANVIDIVAHDTLVLSKEAVSMLTARLRP